MTMNIATDLLAKWFPAGYKSKFQAAPVGLIEDAINLSGGTGPDYGAEIAALTAEVEALKVELALHKNNGEHWVADDIDTRIDTKVAEHVATEHPAS